MHGQGAVGGEGVAPDVLDDVLLGAHGAAVADQVAQEAVLDRGEVQFGAVEPGAAGGLDAEASVVVVGVGLGDGCAAVEGATDLGQQHGQREGLGDVVVAADGQGEDLVVVAPAGRDEDDRGVVVLPDPAAEGEPVHARQVDVEQDHPGGVGGEVGEGVLGGGGVVHAEARRGQVLDRGLGEFAFILDDEDVGAGGHVSSVSGDGRRGAVWASDPTKQEHMLVCSRGY